MTRLVIDCSVVIKWFVPEVHSDKALLLLQGGDDFIAPHHLLVEAANVAAVKTWAGDIDADQAPELLATISERVAMLDVSDVLHAALELAITHRRSAYDSLYVALALREDCQLVTADERLYNALRNIFPGTMLWIGDVPE